MTGTSRRLSTSLASALVPAVLVATEATWASLVLGALVRNGASHRDVPFLALAVPAALAALVASVGSRRFGDPYRRALVLAAPLLVIWLCCAGVYGAATVHVGALDVVHPWTLPGSATSRSVLALVTTGLAVLRGAWLGLGEPQLGSVVASVAVGALAFLVIFVVAALHSHERFAHEVAHDAAVLLLVAFPGALATLALVHERDLERRSLGRPPARPSAGWLLAVGAPMAAVGGVALLVVFVLAPVAPILGHLLASAGRGIGALLAALARLLGHLSLHGQAAPARANAPAFAKLPPLGLRPEHVPGWLVALGALLAALLVAGALVLLGRLWRHRPRRKPTRTVATVPDEQRDSVFSLAHLLDQIRAALGRLGSRATGGSAGGAQDLASGGSCTEPESVRREYRRMLRAARVAGRGRTPGETALELASRLGSLPGPEPEPGPAASLALLTDLYDEIRYGDATEDARDRARASSLADAVVSSLVGPEPRHGAPGSS